MKREATNTQRLPVSTWLIPAAIRPSRGRTRTSLTRSLILSIPRLSLNSAQEWTVYLHFGQFNQQRVQSRQPWILPDFRERGDQVFPQVQLVRLRGRRVES